MQVHLQYYNSTSHLKVTYKPHLQQCDEKNNINVITDACILSTSDEHDANREDLLRVGVGWHVAEAHAGQTAEGEVERRDVDAADGGAAPGPVHTSYGVVRRLQALP